jgi:membrane peptidoglycan carboxypeptidase
VGSASISYFGKSVDKLTYGEAAVLAGIIQQPSIAMVNSEESELVIKNRQQYVIEQLHKHRSKLGIDEDAEIDSDYVIQRQYYSVDVLHFVHYVENKLRTEYNLRDIHNKGYRIYTTLNMQKQNQYLMLLRGNESSIVEDTAIAAVVLDSVSGGVRVYVGSLYYDEEILGSKIDMTQVPRMAGGTILPFSYAKAFEKGLQVYSLAPELPYTLMGKPDFSIRYDEGGMSVRKSLATGNPISSLYVADYASPVEIRDMFVEAGLLDVKSFIGISESIGNLEVNLLSLVSAYTVFANGGSYNKAYVIERIEDQAGKVIYMYDTSDSRRIISNGTVDKINWILCDMGGYQDRVGQEYMGQIDGVCGRTGLSGNQDSYTSVLYDKDNISGVWYGRINSNEPLPSSDNYNHSLDLNAAAYQSVFRGSNPIRLSEEYKLVDVCTDSGKEQNKQSCSSERAIMVGNGGLASDERFTVHLCIVENGYVESMDDVNRAIQNGFIQTKTYIEPFLENSEHIGTYNVYLNDFGYITPERYQKLAPVSCELPLE